MRRPSFYFLVGLAALTLLAGARDVRADNPQQDQIDAANYDAVDRLRADVVAQRLSPNLTIAEFLQRTGGEAEMLNTLRKANQVGGVRWPDNDTCQVQLTIPAVQLREALVNIAANNQQSAPLPAQAINAKLQNWASRTFTATGTSVSPARVETLRPPPGGQWDQVPDKARQRAIDDARAAAVGHVIDSIKPIQIAPGKTVADLLADKPALTEGFRQWLLSRPAIRLEFNNNLSVQITLAAGPGHAFDALHDLAGDAKSTLLPNDPAVLAKIRLAFQDQMVSAIGQAAVVAPAAAAPAQAPAAPVALPDQPPAWVFQQQTGAATANYRGSALKTERNAENAAFDDLRSKIGQLQINSSTIADLAKQNPAIAKAVDRAVEQAKAFHIDFKSDGKVAVQVNLDGQVLWGILQQAGSDQ